MTELKELYDKVSDKITSFVVDEWTARLLDTGVDYADIRRNVDRIDRWKEWLSVWVETGDNYFQMAEKAFQNRNWESAGGHYLRASHAYHFGQFMWFGNIKEKRETYRKAAEAYKKAAPLFNPLARRIEFPWNGHTIAGYVRIPNNQCKPPLVIIAGGADAWKEEMSRWADLFLERNIATVTFDGPSQGELSDVPLGHNNFESAVSVLLDWMQVNYPEIDTSRVAIVGISMGGYYAPRCAAADNRFVAACGIGGPFDLSDFDARPDLLKVNLSQLMGFNDLATATEMAPKVVDLSDIIGNLRCPLLIVHGDNDKIINVSHAQRIVEGASSKDKELRIIKGGNHVCNNYFPLFIPGLLDWMSERLFA